MKRIIEFEIISGEHVFGDNMGFPFTKLVEFETDNVSPMDDGFEALKKEMGDTPYTITYWYWRNVL
jgi:hypothetical protein